MNLRLTFTQTIEVTVVVDRVYLSKGQMLVNDIPLLQRTEIPTGWTVCYNDRNRELGLICGALADADIEPTEESVVE